MDLNQFITDAVRTESRIDHVTVNPKMLFNVLALHIASGQMLDQIKKHVFYAKPYNADTFNASYYMAQNAFGDIGGLPLEGDLNEKQIEVNPRIFHGIVGIATESTELCEALYKGMMQSDGQFDGVNLLEEVGDLDWYKAIMVDALGADWEQVLVTVIAKLKSRYPDKFTNENAINRDTVAERKILETKLR